MAGASSDGSPGQDTAGLKPGVGQAGRSGHEFLLRSPTIGQSCSLARVEVPCNLQASAEGVLSALCKALLTRRVPVSVCSAGVLKTLATEHLSSGG